MKKSIAFLILTTSIICHAATSENNPRNILVTAIARSDFGTTLKALEQITDMTDQEQYQYMQMADQIIIANTMWLATHSTHPEIGKDLFKGIGYLLGTLASAAISVGGVAVITDVIDQNSINNPPLFIVALASLGLTGFLGYKSISKFIDAWQNPSIRLENALRIKDAIAHHLNLPETLQMNTQGGYSTAIGIASLPTESAYDTAVGCSHLSYNHTFSNDCNICKCNACLNAIAQQQKSAYHLIGYESTALGISPLEKLSCCCHSTRCECGDTVSSYGIVNIPHECGTNPRPPLYFFAVGSTISQPTNENIQPCCCPSETNFSCRCTDHTCVKYSNEQA